MKYHRIDISTRNISIFRYIDKMSANIEYNLLTLHHRAQFIIILVGKYKIAKNLICRMGEF